jgi:hypothetical protein
MQFEWGECWGQVGQVFGDEAVDGFLADEQTLWKWGRMGLLRQ